MKDDKYIFIDRDGVINRDPDGWTIHGYVTRWEDFFFLEGVFTAFKKLKTAGYKTVIISNQQGVGKGYFTKEALDDITNNMVKTVKQKGGAIEKVYYCTHKKEEDCSCRKPKKGLFLTAKKEFGIEGFDGKFFVGDTERDMESAKRVNLKAILVLSGKSSREDVKGWDYKPDYICEDLLEAAKLVLTDSRDRCCG